MGGSYSGCLPAFRPPPGPRLEQCSASSHFLADETELRALVLITAEELPVPTNFLAAVPHLITLILAIQSPLPLPATFLSSVLHLTHLQLWIGQQELLPEGFLLPVLHLTTLELAMGWNWANHLYPSIRTLQTRIAWPFRAFFAPVPYLTSLALRVDSDKFQLPPPFLPPESPPPYQLLYVAQLTGDNRKVQTLTQLTLMADRLTTALAVFLVSHTGLCSSPGGSVARIPI